jgi:RHS repeat-associated protein
VSFAYDPLLRRVAKRLYIEEVAGERRLAAETRYAWDQEQLIHERRESFDEEGKSVEVEERTYLYEATESMSPFAERIVRNGAAGAGWLFYCTDMMGTPEDVISGDGRVVASIRRTSYGKVNVEGEVSTKVRFPGQFEDEETGLVYNRYRYYDPEIGRYISPDPLGTLGGLNAFAYTRNPIDYADPLGLADKHTMAFAVFDAGGSQVSPKAWNTLTSGEDSRFKGKFWRGESTGHSERKALALMSKPKQLNALRNGGTAKMAGQFPPCKVCHKAMDKWAQDNLKGTKGKIQYHYPVNQTVTYTGDGPETGHPNTNASKLVNDSSWDEYTRQKKVAQANPGATLWSH